MKLFTNFRKGKISVVAHPSNSLSHLLAFVQTGVAGMLNNRTAAWSQKMKKTMLGLFCLLFGYQCLYVAGKAILSGNGPPIFSIGNKIHIPITLNKIMKVDSLNRGPVP